MPVRLLTRPSLLPTASLTFGFSGAFIHCSVALCRRTKHVVLLYQEIGYDGLATLAKIWEIGELEIGDR